MTPNCTLQVSCYTFGLSFVFGLADFEQLVAGELLSSCQTSLWSVESIIYAHYLLSLIYLTLLDTGNSMSLIQGHYTAIGFVFSEQAFAIDFVSSLV